MTENRPAATLEADPAAARREGNEAPDGTPEISAPERGADRRTPSIPQYFSWINNTWEGSTEEQTLINLDFFEWMKKTYGMQLGIYLWDAGNFDGPSSGYGDEDGEKFRAQYPDGFGPVVKRAEELGIRMGLWCGPDGFGDTPEEERKRFRFLLDLCRKYHFGLFKIDSACGGLRPEKAKVYGELLRECRKYCPDLVVLNHRLELYEAERYVTTFLWQGVETYADVHSANRETCMHHRGFIFRRGLPEGLERLAEDHGVCISSSVAYFEDDLIYQAFGRSMIMAPEIYANPWLMRDDEFPKLARIFNLHRAAAPILVDGMVLPPSYGDNAVSRGTPDHRFIAAGHHGWTPMSVRIRLDGEIGLGEQTEKIALIERHPAERLIGFFDYGDTAEVSLMPFRACLLEIAPLREAYPVLEDCEYEMIREDGGGRPVEVKMLRCGGGPVTLLDHGNRSVFGDFAPCDRRDDPVLLDGIYRCDTVRGRMLEVSYRLDGSPLRFFRLPRPMDRIHAVRLLKEGREIALRDPRANNLQAPFEAVRPAGFLSAEVTLPELRDGDYLAVAVNGVHGEEGVSCTAEIDGDVRGFPDRAPAFRANMWEYVVAHADRNYTFFLPLKGSDSGRTADVRLQLCGGSHPAEELNCCVWLCPKH